MSNQLFPKPEDFDAVADTRDAVHAYARVLGDCLKACRQQHMLARNA